LVNFRPGFAIFRISCDNLRKSFFTRGENLMKFFITLFSVLLLVSQTVSAQIMAPTFNVEELLKVRRVSDPQVSPDGKLVAYAVGDVKLEDNRVVNQIYVVSIDGGAPKQLTETKGSSSTPRWSPDGKKIAYGNAGQIWTMNADGSDKKQITTLSSGAGNPVWSPDGNLIAFVSDVYPDCSDDACNQRKDEAAEKSKVKAVVTERLLFRHWNEWRDKKRTHLFVVSSNGGTAKQITSGDWDSPPYAASSFADYAFSPDSKEIAFLRNPDKVEATSTNSDIYTVAVNGGTAKNITRTNLGYDASPMYTKDGKYIIYRSQATATFEADRWRLMRFDRQNGQAVELTRGFDEQVEDFTIAPDSKTIYFTAGQRGRTPIFSVLVEPVSKTASPVRKVFVNAFASNLQTADGKSLVFAHASSKMPPEIMRINSDGNGLTALTTTNAGMMQSYGLQDLEEIEWIGAANTKIHGFLTFPANFDKNKKYPLIVLIHGGPQGAWFDGWSYRWNPQVWANQGYVVFLPNPRGSTTYGQKFVNEISGDWGGKVFDDIKNGVAEVIKKPYIDKNRIGGAGASYGGYMVNWILGHNNDPRFKFKALLSHAGVYNLESMAGVTEELWFTNWEFKGMPWTNPAMYAKWSPHKFAANFKTPTLVTHGEQDFRVPIGEGLQLYTALQMNGTDSKLIYFPDEGHWILKPQNSEFWHKNVFEWFAKYLKP
jgi:dipeptidyl aminopeptidase/acylaminoacyl peptidase